MQGWQLVLGVKLALNLLQAEALCFHDLGLGVEHGEHAHGCEEEVDGRDTEFGHCRQEELPDGQIEHPM